MLDEPAAEWCYGFLMLGDVGDNPRVSYHAAAEESVETMDDLAGYLETSLAKTQAAVAEAERLLLEREGARSPNPARSPGRSAGLSALASLAVHALDGGNKKRLKKSQDPAKVQALEVQVKDPKEPFDLALLDGFTALELLTVVQAPASIKLALLQSHKTLSELALSMDVAAAASETSWLPDLAEVTLPSLQTAQLWNLGRISSWSALRAFPNVRELELSLSGSGHEIDSLDIWPEAEAISIVGDGEGVQLAAATRLPSKLQRLALSSLGLAQMPVLEGGAALLELDLDWNCIGGTIDWSASLPQLTSLRLMHNQIEGISTLQGYRSSAHSRSTAIKSRS